ncbi:hypothetical protein BJX99DRAFT_46230 [Aspergillus californicus]
MRMSRPTTLLHILLGLRTSTATATTSIRPFSHLSLYQTCLPTNLYNYTPNPFTSPGSRIISKNAYSTMSTPHPESQTQPQSQPHSDPSDQTPDHQPSQKPILALPESSDSSGSSLPQLDVNGEGVKLDHLGPLIVNTDGTLARISNWEQMTEIERRNTMRVLGKRNKARLDALKANGEGLEGK